MLGVFGKLWKHRGNRLIQREQVCIEKPHGENSGNGTGAQETGSTKVKISVSEGANHATASGHLKDEPGL